MRNVELLQEVMKMDDVSLEAKIKILNREDPAVFALTTPALMHAELRPVPRGVRRVGHVHERWNASTAERRRVWILRLRRTRRPAAADFLQRRASASRRRLRRTPRKKRASDYSASTDMRMRMSRHPIPEGTSKCLDALLSFTDSFNQVNIDLGKAEAAQIAGEGPSLPEPSPEDDSGDQGVQETAV